MGAATLLHQRSTEHAAAGHQLPADVHDALYPIVLLLQEYDPATRIVHDEGGFVDLALPTAGEDAAVTLTSLGGGDRWELLAGIDGEVCVEHLPTSPDELVDAVHAIGAWTSNPVCQL